MNMVLFKTDRLTGTSVTCAVEYVAAIGAANHTGQRKEKYVKSTKN